MASEDDLETVTETPLTSSDKATMQSRMQATRASKAKRAKIMSNRKTSSTVDRSDFSAFEFDDDETGTVVAKSTFNPFRASAGSFVFDEEFVEAPVNAQSKETAKTPAIAIVNESKETAKARQLPPQIQDLHCPAVVEIPHHFATPHHDSQ